MENRLNQMRYFFTLLLFFVAVEMASALTPLPDSSPGFFSGEWSGTGSHGSYCFMNIAPDGQGLLLIDGGAGDWLGAQIRWRNRQQAFEVEKIIPMKASSELRIIPLEHFSLSTEFNQSIKLTWGSSSNVCYLQKSAAAADHLARFRKVMKMMPSSRVDK